MIISYMIHIMKISEMHIDSKTVFITLGIIQVSNELFVFFGQNLVLSLQHTPEIKICNIPTLNRTIYYSKLNSVKNL